MIGRNHHIDKAMTEAVDFMKNQGAEIIEIKDVVEPKVYDMEFQILLYELKFPTL